MRKIWELLTLRQRRSAAVLGLSMIIGALLETLGVGMVIPALTLMMQTDLAQRYPAFAPVLAALGHPSAERLVVLGMAVLVSVYLIKTAFLVFLTYRQIRFAFAVQAELSHRLLVGYLRQPYAFHLRRNSAQLIRNAVTEVDLFTKLALTAGLTLLTESLVIVGIAALLIAVEPVGAISVVVVLALAGWGFQLLTHRRILRWGERRQFFEGQRIQDLQQCLGGVKEVKVLGREAAFSDKYRQHSLSSTSAAGLQSIMQQMPRLALELLAVVGLAALVIVLINAQRSIDALLPTLGLFAAAAFRLLPSATRLMSSSQNVRYSVPIVDVLHAEVTSVRGMGSQSAAGQPFAFHRSVELKNVTFAYADSHAEVLKDVSLTVASGQSIGIVGGSGAGKSTLVDVILGLLPPTSGAVFVDGVDISNNLRGWQDCIGYVPQSVFLTDDTLARNVAFGLPDEQIDEDAVWRALAAAQLEDYVKSLPQGLQTQVGERGVRLSGGQLQRIGIARALYRDPPVLVLDEATSALDSAVERGVIEAVRALHGRKTIFIVAHRLSTVEHCDRLLRLEAGRLVHEGTPADVLAALAAGR